jgi:hypothetical protein
MGKYIDVEKLNSLIDNKLEELGTSGSVWVGRSVLCELKDEIKSLQSMGGGSRRRGLWPCI